jgi:hypothetical protein
VASTHFHNCVQMYYGFFMACVLGVFHFLCQSFLLCYPRHFFPTSAIDVCVCRRSLFVPFLGITFRCVGICLLCMRALILPVLLCPIFLWCGSLCIFICVFFGFHGSKFHLNIS